MSVCVSVCPSQQHDSSGPNDYTVEKHPAATFAVPREGRGVKTMAAAARLRLQNGNPAYLRKSDSDETVELVHGERHAIGAPSPLTWME